jgi:predicted RNA-binding Zn ribbon-like protein
MYDSSRDRGSGRPSLVIVVASDVSLEFANTAEWHAGSDPKERLTSYGKAVEWGRRVGVLSDSQAQSLLARADADPRGQQEALRRIIALREAVYHIFSAVAHRRPPDPADLELLNAEFTTALAHLRLVTVPGLEPGEESQPEQEGSRQFAWIWTGIEDDLTSLLWPVARAASSLLTSEQSNKVRECAGDPCGWVFLDLSRNASRRWCDMADCGNRAKARRYRERRKEETHQPPQGVEPPTR